ncbi:lipopolysaccharide biosynthesis protein [Streptomyces sp. NBC_01615]|uniref:lipopolysaccharide biosynthesis protein n=1 Tax=Streptomyces sp. NBC_01615 TaxID=2975898 RepID=UPI003869D4BC
MSLRPSSRTSRIIHLAGPMTVISTTSALAYGTDRLVLSHVAGAVDVAVYSAGAQLYSPASSLISAAGLPLWALFTRHRTSDGRLPRAELLRLTRWFTAAAVVIGGVLVAAGPFVASWMTHGRVVVGGGLMAAFASLTLVHAVNYPVGMWLTDAAGLRFQAVRTAAMAALSLALSIPLAAALGPVGPVLASTVAFGSCVVVPCFRRVFRKRPSCIS